MCNQTEALTTQVFLPCVLQESTRQADKRMMAAASPANLEALQQSSLEEDLSLVNSLRGHEALAVGFRIALKSALGSLDAQ